MMFLAASTLFFVSTDSLRPRKDSRRAVGKPFNPRICCTYSKLKKLLNLLLHKLVIILTVPVCIKRHSMSMARASLPRYLRQIPL